MGQTATSRTSHSRPVVALDLEQFSDGTCGLRTVRRTRKQRSRLFSPLPSSTSQKKSSCLFEYGEWTVHLKTTFSPHSSYVSEIHRLECSNRQIYSSCARYALLL